MEQNSINEALRAFEATEANLSRMEFLWSEIRALIPEGIEFGDSTEGVYDDKCRAFEDLHSGLPKIDGATMGIGLQKLNEIAQMRFDALELGEISCQVTVEDTIFEQARHLKEYRFNLNKKRRQLIRKRLNDLINSIDASLRDLHREYPDAFEPTNASVEGDEWQSLKDAVTEIDVLLGSSVKRPQRWNDLRRHASYGMVQDLLDIRRHDWPTIKTSLSESMYGEYDPIPVGVEDLGTLVASEPSGKVVTCLEWKNLSDDEFERLLFSLISDAPGYENPQWLTRTNAPDRGRDLSVYRTKDDPLSGVSRQRVIIQCKHWLAKSVPLTEVSSAKEQMSLWSPPHVDVLVIATSGRFTTDTVQYVEYNNQADSRLHIEMWPECHLERLLASRPALIAEFRLR